MGGNEPTGMYLRRVGVSKPFLCYNVICYFCYLNDL